MMRRYLVALCFVASTASAGSVGFDFKAVSVVSFMEATFKAMLKRDFVISPEVLAMDKKITVSVRYVKDSEVPAFVESILADQGISVVEKGGVYYVTAKGSLPAQGGPVVPGVPVVAPAPAAIFPAAVPVDSGLPTESTVFVPMHRPSEFMGTAMLAVFGAKAVAVVGSSLVFSGTADEVRRMVDLAKSVDLAPASVDVSVSWVEVARTNGAARGVSLVANVLGARLGVSLGGANSGGAISIAGTKFQAVLDALDSDGRFKQVSNSRIVGDDREALTLTVGDETPTIGSTGKDNQGNSLQNVVYRPSGVIVHVTPKVLGDGKINLVIDGQISSFKSTVTGVSSSPTLIKRQVKTGVTVKPGEVLLIGGLSDEHSNDSKSSLAFLPSSWSVKSRSSVVTDLVLVISAKSTSLE